MSSRASCKNRQQPAEFCALRAGCKANLYLEIVGRREDGLHEIKSLFLPLQQPSDELRIRKAPPGTGFSLSCSLPELASRENILFATYERYGQQTGFWPDLRLHLHKGIPHGSGLGGASSDAAAFLKYLQEQTDPRTRLPADDMHRLAASLGSDVPFFLSRTPAWVTGAGERITSVRLDLRGWRIVVLCPDIRISTSWAYRQWDRLYADASGAGSRPLTDAPFRINERLCSQGQVWRNGFEKVVFHQLPALRSFKERLLMAGARAVVLSGSGASMIALFKDSPEIKGLQDVFSEQGADVFVNVL